jgi:hypothetical protein
MTTLTTTEHGLDLDESFAEPAAEDVLQDTAEALRARGHTVLVVDDPAAAKAAVLDLLPPDRNVFTMSSVTLQATGLEEEINTSGRYDAIRPRIYAMDFPAQQDDIRRLGAAADVVIGSVHAVTADGTMVTTSSTGSQLALYAFGAGHVVHVVGAQKLVPGPRHRHAPAAALQLAAGGRALPRRARPAQHHRQDPHHRARAHPGTQHDRPAPRRRGLLRRRT